MNEATIKAKEAQVVEISEKIEKAQSIIFLDYRGLTVAEVTDLRNKMRAEDVEYKVIKNALLRRAAEKLNITGLDEDVYKRQVLNTALKMPLQGRKALS